MICFNNADIDRPKKYNIQVRNTSGKCEHVEHFDNFEKAMIHYKETLTNPKWAHFKLIQFNTLEK